MYNGKYSLIQGIYTIDSNDHIGYGIAYKAHDKIIAFEDISLNLEKLSTLVNLCNSLMLSPLHLSDVVNDFLADIT